MKGVAHAMYGERDITESTDLGDVDQISGDCAQEIFYMMLFNLKIKRQFDGGLQGEL